MSRRPCWLSRRPCWLAPLPCSCRLFAGDVLEVLDLLKGSEDLGERGLVLQALVGSVDERRDLRTLEEGENDGCEELALLLERDLEDEREVALLPREARRRRQAPVDDLRQDKVMH